MILVRLARFAVKHEEYNGNTNARIKSWEQSDFNGCNHVFKENPMDGFTNCFKQ